MVGLFLETIDSGALLTSCSLKTSTLKGGRSLKADGNYHPSSLRGSSPSNVPSFDHEERTRKRRAREVHKQSHDAQNLRGLRAKLFQKARHAQKIQMKKQIKAHEERNVKSSAPNEPSTDAKPEYLLDRSNTANAKALSSTIKNKRKEAAAKFAVPLPRVRGIAEEEMFKVVKTGKKTAKKGWKRMITKPTFVGADFTRRPVKYERFIRPMGLRYKKANVTHPELGVTVLLPIISVGIYLSPYSNVANHILQPRSRRILKVPCLPNWGYSPRGPSLKST